MRLVDINTAKEWGQFEKELYERFDLNCTVYDASGIGVTGIANWCNRLCPKIKGNKESLAVICAAGNQHFMLQAQKTKRPVIGECDAGLIKIAVPIFSEGVFLGTAGGCGRLPEGGAVETFIIRKTTGLSDNTIAELCRSLTPMSQQQVGKVAEFIETSVARFVDGGSEK